MGQRELLLAIVKILDKYKIPYLLTGSLASSYYGIPRATHDIDFVIEVQKDYKNNLLQAVDKLDRSYLVSKKDIEKAVEDFSTFNIFHLESGIKIDFWLSKKGEFELGKFKRKREVKFGRIKVKLISPEDLIITKLLWCKDIRSEKHIQDCAGIWKTQKEKLDKDYLSSWTKKLGIEKLLKEISS